MWGHVKDLELPGLEGLSLTGILLVFIVIPIKYKMCFSLLLKNVIKCM